MRHYSYRTEKAYVHWIKRCIFFHNKRHPQEMAESEIAAFLSSLASADHVSAATQNQALNALLFLYNEVLKKKIGMVQGVRTRQKAKAVTSGADQGRSKEDIRQFDGDVVVDGNNSVSYGTAAHGVLPITNQRRRFFTEPNYCSKR
jgi:Phage integrase, N-terminal SAM-like domain